MARKSRAFVDAWNTIVRCTASSRVAFATCDTTSIVLLLAQCRGIYNNVFVRRRIAIVWRRSHLHVFSLQSGHRDRHDPANALRSAQQGPAGEISAKSPRTDGPEIPGGTPGQWPPAFARNLAACRFGRRSTGRRSACALFETTLSRLAAGGLDDYRYRAKAGPGTN